MNIISHRGNITGPILDKENRPSYIDCAIGLGYEVEVDIRYIDDIFYLGHDTADYVISENWIKSRKTNIWFHCKNLQAATALSEMNDQIMFFCHSNDPYVMTSNNYIWVHDLTLPLNTRCIIPLLDEKSIMSYNGDTVHGVCTDFVNLCKSTLQL